MAGRPKRRAQKAAGDKPEQPPESWAENLTRDLMTGGAPGLSTEPEKPVKSDRELLAAWWRDQVTDIERAGRERDEGLAQGGAEVCAKQARVFGALGVPKDVAAVLMGLSEAQLEMGYGREYAIGNAEMVGQVATNLLRIATSSDDRYAVKAAIEVMNRRGGEEWRPPAQKIELDDARKPKNNVIDSSQLSYEDRQALRLIIQRARGLPVESAGLAAGQLIEGSSEQPD